MARIVQRLVVVLPPLLGLSAAGVLAPRVVDARVVRIVTVGLRVSTGRIATETTPGSALAHSSPAVEAPLQRCSCHPDPFPTTPRDPAQSIESVVTTGERERSSRALAAFPPPACPEPGPAHRHPAGERDAGPFETHTGDDWPAPPRGPPGPGWDDSRTSP